MLISASPPALIAPAPPAPGAASFQQDFNAAARPAVLAWVDAETAALLAVPLDLKRLARDADSRAAGASDPTTAALVLRLAVELRLETAFEQRRSVLATGRMASSSPSVSTATGDTVGSAGGESSQAWLMAATQSMQELQMSFNMQYLQLQDSMQNDNRQFTMVSNIMKTKHDTVKNTISNIR